MPASCTAEDHSAEIASAWERQAAAIVGRTIKRIEARAKLKMSEPKSGRVYHRGKHGARVHQASAPGQAPAVDTGNLKAGVQSSMIGKTTGEVAVYPDYGLYLELGTHAIAPRPFLGPSVDEEWPAFVSEMEKLNG
jgi:hypothetical protein